ncbi:MAG: hypothetical protein KAU02_03600 [Tenericutes bacterium]|nr:hypothetical protein [Mycoplasmatota bacterium]
MLGKLIKHEFIASYRTYVPVYAALYIFSLLIFISFRIDISIIGALLTVVFSLLLGAMGLFTVYNLIISLGSRIYGKPGYLLFSIPAKTSEIMLSKFIVNFIWVLASVFVSVTALGIAFSMLGVYAEMGDVLSMIWRDLNFTSTNLIMFVVFGIMIIAYHIVFFMFLFSLLNLIYKGERKIFIGVLLYFALSFALSMIINLFSISVGSYFLTGSENVNLNMIWFIILIYFTITSILLGLSYNFLNKKMELQ